MLPHVAPKSEHKQCLSLSYSGSITGRAIGDIYTGYSSFGGPSRLLLHLSSRGARSGARSRAGSRRCLVGRRTKTVVSRSNKSSPFFITTSVALVTSSVALVTTSFLLLLVRHLLLEAFFGGRWAEGRRC